MRSHKHYGTKEILSAKNTRNETRYAALQIANSPVEIAYAAATAAILLASYQICVAACAVSVWMSGGESALSGPSRILIPTGFALTGIAYLVTCIWIRRSLEFAESVNPTYEHRLTEKWTWLSWWAPIVCLWFPAYLIDDLRKSTLGEGHRSVPVWTWCILWAVPFVVRDDSPLDFLGNKNPGIAMHYTAMPGFPLHFVTLAVCSAVGTTIWIVYMAEIVRGQRESRTTLTGGSAPT